MGRTTWKFGQLSINFLVIGITHHRIALPIAWVNLDKTGNSSTSERTKLLERVLSLVPASRIFGFATDREFIGEVWFLSLLEYGLNPVIRIKQDMVIQHRLRIAPAWAWFNALKPCQMLELGKARVMGVRVYVIGTLTAEGELLALVTVKRPSRALVIDALRWGIETLFGAFKTRGFDLEDTRMTSSERSEGLFALLVVALIWAVMVGEFLTRFEPLRVRNHGWAVKSVFTRGLDCLRKILLSGQSGKLVLEDVIPLLSGSQTQFTHGSCIHSISNTRHNLSGLCTMPAQSIVSSVVRVHTHQKPKTSQTSIFLSSLQIIDQSHGLLRTYHENNRVTHGYHGVLSACTQLVRLASRRCAHANQEVFMSRRLRTGTIIASLFIAAPVIGLAYSALQQATFRDIPAGHWATQAVEYVTQQGLIQGYPDQTFQGQRNLTRYEAATIFYRLLQSGKLQAVDPQARDMITKGIDEVKGELAAVETKLGTLETNNGQNAGRLTTLENQVKTLSIPAAPTTNAETDARIKALEDQIKALQSAPAPTPAPPVTSPEVDARIKALEDQVKTLSTPAPPTPATISPELDARLKALEDKVNAAPTATPTPVTSPEVEARLKALESQTVPQPDASKADAGQDTQIAVLEARLKALEDRVNATPAVTPPPPTPVVTTPPPPPTPVDLAPPPPPPAPRVPNFTIGLGASTPVIPTFNLSNINVAGFIGLRRVIGPIGLRANFDLNLSNQTLSLGPDLIFEFAPTSFLDPYLGLGAGGVFGLQNSLFLRGVVGLNLNFSPAFGLWLEADPRYYLLNTSGFTFSVRAGLKLSL